MTSRLVTLAQAIKDLPQADSKRNQLRTLVSVREHCAPVLEAIRRAEIQAPFVAALANQEVKLARLLEAARAQIGAEAKRLVKLTNRNEFGGERAISNALDALKKAPVKATAEVREAWSGVQSRADGFREIARISEQAGVGEAQKLQAAIRNYSSAVQTPPGSQAELQSIKKLERQLEESVASIGLTGNVKSFLLEAAQGHASARDVLSEEVAAFLERNPGLWGRLRIRLV
jgi:hypothetical protein